MKSLLAAIGLFSALSLCAAQPASEEEFKAAYRTAMAERSVEKLEALTYTVGMSDQDKATATKMMAYLPAGREIESVHLKALPADLPREHIARGKKIEMTAPPVGIVEVVFAKGGEGMNTVSAPYAIVDGKYYVVGAKATDLNWSGPPDKTLNFMVIGSGMKDAQIKVRWNASGVDIEREFSQPSSSFLGQHIEQITVTSGDPSANLILSVREEGKEIYKSEPLKGAGTLEYKR